MDADKLNEISWKIIDKYFTENPDCLVSHQLESFNNFFNNDIFQLFKNNNPIRFREGENECLMYLGGKDASKIYFGKPVIYEKVSANENTSPQFMYPNIARLKNITYGFTIHYDVEIDFLMKDENKEKSILVEKIYLGKFPIMLHSDFCILKGLDKKTIYNFGECYNDLGGYFIIDGKEKVVISELVHAVNTIFIPSYYTAEIFSKSYEKEKKISLEIVKPNDYYSNGQILVTIEEFEKPIPLFILMRALGVYSDREIIQTCLLDLNKYSSYIDLFIPSVHDSSKIFNQQNALQYLSNFAKKKTNKHVLYLLKTNLFPHVGGMNFKDKAMFLGYMVLKLLQVNQKDEKKSNLFSLENTKVKLVGDMLFDTFQDYLQVQKKGIIDKMEKEYFFYRGQVEHRNEEEVKEKKDKELKSSFMDLIESNFKNYFIERDVEKGIINFFTSNSNVFDLDRQNWFTYISQMRQIQFKNKEIFNSFWGFIDPYHFSTTLCSQISISFSKDVLIGWLKENTAILWNASNFCLEDSKVFINGAWLGTIKDPLDVLNHIKILKRNGVLPFYLSIYFNYKNNELHFRCDGGRILRPVYFVNNGELSFHKKQLIENLENEKYSWEQIVSGLKKKDENINFSFKQAVFYNIKKLYPTTSESNEKINDILFNNQSIIDFVDVNEQFSNLIANSFDDLSKNKFYTLLEIHPSLIFGVFGNLICFPEHNPFLLNMKSCNSILNCIAKSHTNMNVRFDSEVFMSIYNQTPLVKSRYVEYMEQSYGENLITAICNYTGFDSECSIIINKSAVERGLFKSFCFQSYESEEDENKKFSNLKQANTVKAGIDYSKLNENGVISEKTKIHGKTALIGKLNDETVFSKNFDDGVVEKVVTLNNNDNNRVAKVKICIPCDFEVGDVISSRCGSKGVISLLMCENDLPFNSKGEKPDIIINPNLLSKEMNVGQVLEMFYGKVGLIYGCFGEGTAFQLEGPNYLNYGHLLTKADYSVTGNEVLYNGFTGEQLSANIFIGPSFYMREKELVMKKQNITGKGVKDKLTRQPINGSMIGEEEKEAILANGMSSFLNSSFMEKSDDYMMAICNKTGMIAVYNKSQNIFYSPYADGPIQFHVKPNGKMNVKNISRFGKSFSLIKVPYAFKILIQELQAMNIQMRIITDANINQFESMNFSNNINKLLKVDEKKPIEEVVSTFVTNMKLKLTNTKVLKIPEKEENLEEEIKDEVLEELPIDAAGIPNEEENSNNEVKIIINPDIEIKEDSEFGEILSTTPLIKKTINDHVTSENILKVEVEKEEDNEENEKEKEDKKEEKENKKSDEKKSISFSSSSSEKKSESSGGNVKKITF
jgi:DNA-directed RNA polymerase II subunit RPB2